jgi:hypothetical protein
MEIKSKNIILKILLTTITIGIWAIVLQNAGILPTKQNVYVLGGDIDAAIDGSVEVNGKVEIGNTVDVNISEINGNSEVTTGLGKHSVFPYGYMLPVEKW